MSESFGARYAALSTVSERTELEAAEKRRGPFAEVDQVLDRLIRQTLRGERLANYAEDSDGRVVLVPELSDPERSAITDHFEVANQEKRGSWHLPDGETLSTGMMNVAFWWRDMTAFALNAAGAERATPTFRGDPQAVAL